MKFIAALVIVLLIVPPVVLAPVNSIKEDSTKISSTTKVLTTVSSSTTSNTVEGLIWQDSTGGKWFVVLSPVEVRSDGNVSLTQAEATVPPIKGILLDDFYTLSPTTQKTFLSEYEHITTTCAVVYPFYFQSTPVKVGKQPPITTNQTTSITKTDDTEFQSGTTLNGECLAVVIRPTFISNFYYDMNKQTVSALNATEAQWDSALSNLTSHLLTHRIVIVMLDSPSANFWPRPLPPVYVSTVNSFAEENGYDVVYVG